MVKKSIEGDSQLFIYSFLTAMRSRLISQHSSIF